MGKRIKAVPRSGCFKIEQKGNAHNCKSLATDAKASDPAALFIQKMGQHDREDQFRMLGWLNIQSNDRNAIPSMDILNRGDQIKTQ